jgi:hypothetical protein
MVLHDDDRWCLMALEIGLVILYNFFIYSRFNKLITVIKDPSSLFLLTHYDDEEMKIGFETHFINFNEFFLNLNQNAIFISNFQTVKKKIIFFC